MYYFIVNIKSRTGKTKKIWKQIRTRLKELDIEYKAFTTQNEGHATELAQKISNLPDEEIRLVVVGGDGTANEVINGLEHLEKIRFGYIPTGSGNDLGRGLKLKGSTLEILEQMLNSNGDSAMDLGCVTWDEGKCKRYFNISSGIGLDAVVCEQALHSRLKVALNRLGLGKLTYLFLTLRSLATMPEAGLKISIDGEETKEIDRMIFTAAMNHPYEGGGIPMAPEASATDGMLSLCCIYGFNRWQALFALPYLLKGKQHKLKGFEIYNCKEADIWIDRPMIVHTDGECNGEWNHIQFTCMPKALRLMMDLPQNNKE